MWYFKHVLMSNLPLSGIEIDPDVLYADDEDDGPDSYYLIFHSYTAASLAHSRYFEVKKENFDEHSDYEIDLRLL